MINSGCSRTIFQLPDGWTAVRKDKSLSAQFEHSIGVTLMCMKIYKLNLLEDNH